MTSSKGRRAPRAEARIANRLGALALALGDEMLGAIAASDGPGPSDAAALVTVGAEPGSSLEALAGMLALSQSATVRLIDRLEAAGLIERRHGPDRRTLALHLSGAGERRMQAILNRRESALVKALGALSASERETLGALMGKMLSAMTDSDQRASQICRLCDEVACGLESCPVEAMVTRAD
jgi:DNA-binding MarR family transcriptional regulator